MREQTPFASADGSAVFVGRFEDCARVLTDPSMSSQELTPGPETARSLRPSFLALDPPDHTRLRRLVSKAFSPRLVAGQAARVGELVAEALDSVAHLRQFDVVDAVSRVVPGRIIGEWVGVPEPDGPALREWTSTATIAMDPYIMADPTVAARVAEAQDALEDYCRWLVARRRDQPEDDLVSRLVQVRDQGEQQLTEADLLATLNLLLVAGQDTATNLISNGILALLRNPSQLARLESEPGLSDAAVEETLRFDPPVQLVSRMATTPRTFGEVEVVPGQRVMVLLAAAGRDPAVNAEPDQFLVDRSQRSHLAFSAGPHFCFGASLARLQAGTVFREFVSRVVNPVLDDTSLRYRSHLNLRGPDSLAVRCDGIRAVR
jgi:cytochrome P450